MNQKIDKRIRYFLIVDTETANTRAEENGKLDMSDTLVYDIGFAVIDKRGKVYESYSFINRDIFVYMRDLMKSAYYANKIPLYLEDIKNKNRTLCDWFEIKMKVREIINKYNIDTAVAHNAYFDYNALNKTERYITKSKYRYFLPYGVKFYDTLKMSADTIVKQKNYVKFCKENNYLTSKGQVKKTAEILYKYITGNVNFIENHTGLEDVLIEKEIFAYCYKQHKKMRKELFNDG